VDVQFHDIPADPAEQNNLAAQHPEIVAQLSEKGLAWLETLPTGPVDPVAGRNAYPWPRAKQP